MAPVVSTTAGRVEGREKDDVLLFAGIPYAAPPVGDLRYRPPQPHEGWSGIRDAQRFGKVAVQPAGPLERLAGGGEPDWDEDCLFLNVQTPSTEGSRPVMVWIHGGGFTSGAGSIPWYDGARLASHGDVVVVTINYRLGVLGWLHLAHLDPSYPDAGNAGLLDQIAALHWVRDNIAAFGGDPQQVTVFGESAGAMSIATLMGTPGAKGLFQRAVSQSGAAHNTWPAEEAAWVTDRVMAAVGVSDVEGLLAADPAALLEAQVKVAAEVTRERATRPEGAGMGLPFGPVIDGVVLDRPPIDAIEEGSAADVSLLVGSNRDEWRLFGLMLRSVEDEETILKRLGRMVTDPHHVAAVYRQELDESSHDELWSAIMTDRIFRIPAIRLAEAQARHQPDATFVYLFEWASTAFDGKLCSCHALEVPFVFDNLHRKGIQMFTGPNPPQPLADAMSAAWLSFATTGHPGHSGLPDWPAYDTGTRPTMHFGDAIRLEHDPGPESRAAWDGLL